MACQANFQQPFHCGEYRFTNKQAPLLFRLEQFCGTDEDINEMNGRAAQNDLNVTIGAEGRKIYHER